MSEFVKTLVDSATGPLFQFISEIFLTIVFALLGVILNGVRKNLNVDRDMKYEKGVKNVIIDVVTALNQSMVKDLKKAASDGKLTEAEKAAIMAKAKDNIRGMLTAKQKEYISKKGATEDDIMEILIDSALDELKERAKKKFAEAGVSEYISLDNKNNNVEANLAGGSGEVSECLEHESEENNAM